MIPKIITKEFLDNNPQYIFVFGDNLLRKGLGGAAKLRYHPQSYGFITKKAPNNNDESFYRQKEYEEVCRSELNKLFQHMSINYDKTYLISRLGAGLANKYNIFNVINPSLVNLKTHHVLGSRVILLA